MGKRQLGELQPSELVTSILISDLAAVPMQDLGIPLVQGVIPILTLFSVELLISAFSARSVRVRTFFCGRTSVLIKTGKSTSGNSKTAHQCDGAIGRAAFKGRVRPAPGGVRVPGDERYAQRAAHGGRTSCFRLADERGHVHGTGAFTQRSSRRADFFRSILKTAGVTGTGLTHSCKRANCAARRMSISW